MAEIEFNHRAGSVSINRFLTQRPSSQVAAWVEHRNAATATIDWQFTTDDAQTNLERLHLSFND